MYFWGSVGWIVTIRNLTGLASYKRAGTCSFSLNKVCAPSEVLDLLALSATCSLFASFFAA